MDSILEIDVRPLGIAFPHWRMGPSRDISRLANLDGFFGDGTVSVQRFRLLATLTVSFLRCHLLLVGTIRSAVIAAVYFLGFKHCTMHLWQ